MIFHLSVNIDGAIERLKKGVNLFDERPEKVLEILTNAKNDGKTFYSGCDNMNQDGRCAGHKE